MTDDNRLVAEILARLFMQLDEIHVDLVRVNVRLSKLRNEGMMMARTLAEQGVTQTDPAVQYAQSVLHELEEWAKR